MTDLCVMLPTRKRPELARRCIDSFRETKTLDSTDLILVVDDDDGSYADFTDCDKITLTRGTLVTAVNGAAEFLAPHYDALFLAADDLVFVTKGWDEILLRALEDLGGTGIVFPDGKRRYDVPEHPVISSDFIGEMGHFAEPSLGHFYVDNVWAELGKRTGLIRFVPEAVIEHRHYSVDPETVHDEVYREAEKAHGGPDLAAFHAWRAERMPFEVSRLRRKFNPDVAWVTSRISA
jgi:glycosyltransferase involved in cell wall biosynthesis